MSILQPLILLLLSLLVLVECDDFYSLQSRLLQESSPETSFQSLFRGKVVLIVNGASECGYTESHYRDLYRLQNILGETHFRVIVFPCNDFGAQEPGSEKDIKDFMWWNYGEVPFLMGQKLSILEENRHPVYQFLYDSTSILPDWNFYKYLIDHNGNVIDTFDHTVPVENAFDRIHKAVKEAKKASRNIKKYIKEEL
eukprot:TRINITY_DN26148_c0_g1_i1.p1 TRINITY_DN26148_c0_g1~~TRINITY_DN26148_c0_g1_i1.p1  ORF type:complete len:197 (+),score=26.34 TRINITY_DN26148_c0_g1_i1:39-629(+)